MGKGFFFQVCWVSILDKSLTFPCLWPLTNAPTASVDSLWISPAARPNVEIPGTAAKQRGWLSETENTQVMHAWEHLEDKIKSNQVINVRSWDDYASTNISSGHVWSYPWIHPLWHLDSKQCPPWFCQAHPWQFWQHHGDQSKPPVSNGANAVTMGKTGYFYPWHVRADPWQISF